MSAPKSAILDVRRDTVRAQSRANRERCGELVTLIKRKVEDIRDSFFEVGEALLEINNNALYLAAGHETFGAFLMAQELMSVVQANKLIAVVELVSREDAIQLGPEKAYAVTRYAHAVGETRPISALLRQRDLVDGKSVAQVSVRELQGSARQARARARAQRPEDARRERAQRAARDAQAFLRKHGWEHVLVKPRKHGSAQVFVLTVPEATLRRMTHQPNH